ncbi:MAG: RNA-binding domain-containing protein [Bacteroidota bacterium]
MRTDQTLAIIQDHELFSQLEQEDVESLLAIIEYRNYTSGDTVFDTNTQPSYLFLVEEGQFNLRLPNNTHKEIKVGEIFGEIGFINQDFRSGAVWATQDSTVSCISRSKLLDKEYIRPEVALLIMQDLAKRITTYLRSKEQVSTEEIIRQGESDSVEFKSTLRWNLFTNKKDKNIEHAALKTIAAFLNTQGGILLIGVSDSGEVLGLEKDQFANHDKLLLHLNKLVTDRIDTLSTQFIHTSVEKVNGKALLRIDCQPTTQPAYLREGHLEHFYIRTGPSTTALALSKVYTYIQERFYTQNG